MAAAGNACDWAVLVYDGSSQLLPGIRQAALTSGSSLVQLYYQTQTLHTNVTSGPESRPGSSSHPSLRQLLKPELYRRLDAATLTRYKRIWLLDDDLSLVGVNVHRLVRQLDCLFPDTARAPLLAQVRKSRVPFIYNAYKYKSPNTIMLQPLISGNLQHFDFLNAKNWSSHPLEHPTVCTALVWSTHQRLYPNSTTRSS